MRIDENFINLISYKNSLNEEQFKILGLEETLNWQEKALNKEVSKNDTNLLMLLKGNLSHKAQEQIIKNYHMVLEFNNIKPKVVYEIPKNDIPKEESTPKNSTNEDEETEHIRIYCDGACSGNPGNAGSGLAIYSNKKNPVLLYGAYEEEGTNNIAELNALHQALIIASQTFSENIISIYSDSKYAIDCISTWAYSWKRNGWSKKGGEIKNLELIIEAHNLYEKLKTKIELIHVKGHAGIEGNELADRMAVYTIKAKNRDFAFYSYNKIEEVLALKSY